MSGIVRVELKLSQRAVTLVRQLMLVATGIMLLMLGRLIVIRVPFTPIPFTLQTFSLALVTLLLGRLSWLSVLGYIVLGLSGAPIFALGGGPWYVLQPSFGYIIGFLVAAFIVGRLAEQLYDPKHLVLAALLINGIVYLFGVLWLAGYMILLLGNNLLNALTKAVIVGVVPFIGWDIVKAVSAAMIAYPVKTRRIFKKDLA